MTEPDMTAPSNVTPIVKFDREAFIYCGADMVYGKWEPGHPRRHSHLMAHDLDCFWVRAHQLLRLPLPDDHTVEVS